MDVKPNEAITCVFGSYGFKQDDKKNLSSIWLEGLGVELIEDFVEELIWVYKIHMNKHSFYYLSRSVVVSW